MRFDSGLTYFIYANMIVLSNYYRNMAICSCLVCYSFGFRTQTTPNFPFPRLCLMQITYKPVNHSSVAGSCHGSVKASSAKRKTPQRITHGRLYRKYEIVTFPRSPSRFPFEQKSTRCCWRPPIDVCPDSHVLRIREK